MTDRDDAVTAIVRAVPRMDDGRELLERLVKIDTPSSDRDAIARALSLVTEELEGRGFTTRLVPASDDVPALVAERGDGQPVCMIGHIDTVFGPGEASRRPFQISHDGTATGPGVADMKGGLVGALRCIDLLDEVGSKMPVRVIVNGDEELGSPTSRDVLLEHTADTSCVLVFEPGRPNGAFVTHRRGTVRFRYVVTGIASHSGVAPRRGANAIHELSRRISSLASLQERYRDCDVNVTLLEGGRSINTVPDHAACTVDVRTSTRRSDEDLRRDIQRLANEEGAPGTTCRIEWLASRPPLERHERQDRLIRAFEAAGTQLGERVEFVGTGGGSDGNIIGHLGVPIIDGCGPVGDGYHRVDEFIDLTTIVRRAAICAGAIASLAADDA